MSHGQFRDHRSRYQRHERRLRTAGNAGPRPPHHRDRRRRPLQLHALESLAGGGLARKPPTSPCRRPSTWPRRTSTSCRARSPKSDAEEKIVVTQAEQRIGYDYLLICTGPKLAFEEVPGLGPAARPHAVGLHDPACGKRMGRLPGIPQEAGPDRGRRGARRQLLRPRLRIRDDPRRRPAQAQASRQGADDLRHQRAVYRPHGPGRRRRFQGTDGIRDAPAPHQVDHQCQGRRCPRGRNDGDRARRGRQAEEGSRAAVRLFDVAARVQGRAGRRGGRGPVQSARLRAGRQAPAQSEAPRDLRGRRLRGDPAGGGHSDRRPARRKPAS